MIAILDYGMGNIASIHNMLRRVGGEAIITNTLVERNDITGIILPGVGSFDNAMAKLNRNGLRESLRDMVLDKKIPFLGICLGMQLLFESSEEGNLPGLGFVPGVVRRFKGQEFDAGKLKIPHMGWNIVKPKPSSPLFMGLEGGPRFYFVHSFHVVCSDNQDVDAICNYGGEFTCGVHRGNIHAAQFHPEKSHRFGMRFFENFVRIAC